MSDPIGPGDWVECVDAGLCPNTGKATPLKAGAVYSVAAVGVCPVWDVATVDLVEAPHPWRICGEGYGWAASRFRPIYRRRDGESLTAKLLEGALSGVPAQVVRERSRETIKSGASQ